MFARFYFTRGHYPGHNVCFPSLFSGCKPLGVSRNLTVLPKEEKIIVLLPLFFFFFFFFFLPRTWYAPFGFQHQIFIIIVSRHVRLPNKNRKEREGKFVRGRGISILLLFSFSFFFFFFFLKKKERDGGRGGVVVCVLFSFILYHTYLTAVSAGAAPYSSLLQTAAGRRLGVRSGSETAAGSAAVSSAAGGLL